LAGVHNIDLCARFVAIVEAVSAVAGHKTDSATITPTCFMFPSFQSGALATLNVSLMYPLSHSREALGENTFTRP